MTAASLDDICAEVEVSGPGFINLTLSDSFVADLVAELSADERLGVAPAAHPETVVIDYSAPNVAKEMHVGHLRSTLIGDALARVLGFLGHDVRRENHIGDWGTPFGMLIEHLLDVDGGGQRRVLQRAGPQRVLRRGPPAVRQRPGLRGALPQPRRAAAERRRRDVAPLAHLRDESMRHAGEVYELLGVLLTPEDVVGESFYNPLLPVVVSELDEKGLLVENDGALCVFPEGFENRNGEPLPLIVRKSDGGYGYPATDLAAVRDRTGRIGATRLLYVVAAEQTLHFRLVFAAAADGRIPPAAASRPSTSRSASCSGPTARRWPAAPANPSVSSTCLTEGVERADAAMKERSSELSPERQAAVAHALGIGAVKYADLSTERMRDYVFDWDRMLAFEGDTGPYLQYAHARVRSIFRRAGVAPPAPGAVPQLGEPQERALALQLLGFGAAVEATAETCSPSKLCTYLFELATSFTTFYEACRVLVDDEAVRASQAGAVRPHGPGVGARALAARHRGARADVTGGRGRPLSSARHVRCRPAGAA